MGRSAAYICNGFREEDAVGAARGVFVAGGRH